jgi:3-oxoacyl-[acyl-carrier protein] reductase
MGTLEGKVALVTGAGRGIGAAVAEKLAAEGAGVLAVDLDPRPLGETAERIEAAGGVVEALTADVAAADFGDLAIERLLQRFGDFDILVSNAGYIWNTTIQNTTDEQWQAMMDVHATAPFRLLRAAAPHLRAATARERRAGAVRRRKVVNVSSVSATAGSATQVAYSAAKAAVLGLTRTMAKEWGRYEVNVNCVAFGFIDTRLTAAWEGEAAEVEIGGRSHRVGFPREVAEEIAARVPLGRAGTPQEAAGAIYLLCLPEADYVNGVVLLCDGGAGGL